MEVKKCIVKIPEIPPPSPAELCELQKQREICPDAQLPPRPRPPAPPPKCIALCYERIKNPPVTAHLQNDRPKCVKKRIETGTARCDEILSKKRSQDQKWTCKAVVPPPPPPPTPDFCELQHKDEAKRQCLERMRRYLT